jgi:phage recombination protein Bet
LKSSSTIKEPKVLDEQAEIEIDAYLDSLPDPITPADRAGFKSVCREFQLNPYLREIHGNTYKDKSGKVTLSVVVGYEVYLKRAERTGTLQNWKCRTEGVGQDMKAKLQITRKDRKGEFEWEVDFSEYCQTRWDRERKEWVPTRFWATKPKTMLKKVCISQGFRMCFPEDFAGMPYTSDEIGLQGEQVLPPSNGRNNKPKQDTAKADPDNHFIDGDRLAGKKEDEFRKTDEQNKTDEPEPSGNGSAIGLETMKAAILGNPSFGEPEFEKFLVVKAWIKEGEKITDLKDNQIERLFNNFDKIKELYLTWKEAENASN